MKSELRERLLTLQARDETTRNHLAKDGALFAGYHPEMERVHRANARELESIIESNGWPTERLVGGDGAEAAWLVAQHAISLPDFQRQCLYLIAKAAEAGEIPHRYRAYLTDRIRFNERKPQIFGTIFDWDENGEMNPWPIEDASSVDKRRTAVGLTPIAQARDEIREAARHAGELPPSDPGLRHQEINLWAKKVGWV